MSAAGSSFFALFYAPFWGRFFCFRRKQICPETSSYKALPYSDKAVRRKSIGRYKSSRFCHSVSFKHSIHNQARFYLCMEVQMRVNIRSGRECTVSKPYLDLLHGYTACQKEAGATMPEIMKPDFL